MLPSPVVLKSRGEGTYVLDSAHLLALKKWSEVALLGGTPPAPRFLRVQGRFTSNYLFRAFHPKRVSYLLPFKQIMFPLNYLRFCI